MELKASRRYPSEHAEKILWNPFNGIERTQAIDVSGSSGSRIHSMELKEDLFRQSKFGKEVLERIHSMELKEMAGR